MLCDDVDRLGGGCGCTINDLAVALLCVYGKNSDPSFSLDPNEPTRPDGPLYRRVYYPDEHTGGEPILAGTAFGDTMFEADWLLKQLSFGVNVTSISPLQMEYKLQFSIENPSVTHQN